MKKILFILILTFVSVVSLSAQAAERVAYVRELLSDRLYDEAFLRANQIITEFPGSLESFDARIILAQIQYERGLYAEARMQLMLLLTNPFQLSFQQRALTYSVLGNVFYKEGDFLQAIESFERLYLDYRETSEAQRAIDLYFESYFQIGDYQSVIVKIRELQKVWTDPDIQGELLYHQAKAYIAGNMIEQANSTISEILSKHSATKAVGKAQELQINLIEREQGRQAAIERINATLNEPVSRETEENLLWLLVRYYLEDSATTRLALDRLNTLISKYNLSERLSEYYVVWLRLMTDNRDLRPIFEREEFILRIALNRVEYPQIVYYLALAHSMAQNWWAARGYLDETIGYVRSDNLRFDYQFLYADIFTAQGQYSNSIEIYNSLLNSYAALGRNFEVYIKLGDIYFHHLNQPAQALNFYRQAVSIAKKVEQTSQALLLSSQCQEALGQYTEALQTLAQIPVEQIDNAAEREKINNRITLLQIFYNADLSGGLSTMMMIMASNQQSVTSQAAIIALRMKQWNEALELLKSSDTPEARTERAKLYYLFAYRSMLEGNLTETERYLGLARTESRGASSADQALFNSFADFIANRGKFTSQSVNNALSYINSIEAMSSSPSSANNIDLRNFWTYKVWSYYQESNNTAEMIAIAPKIKQDAFVSNLDYQRVNVTLGSMYYNSVAAMSSSPQNTDTAMSSSPQSAPPTSPLREGGNNETYQKAINHFQQAERYLSLAYPVYYYEYAMSLYHTNNTQQALNILQRLVLNNVDNASLTEARNMIIEHWLSQNRLPDALDILNQIPPVNRTDSDYRYLATVYQRLGDNAREKDALLYVRNKTTAEFLRLGRLHFLTGDRVMAQWTFDDVLGRTEEPIDKLNIYASVGNMSYVDEDWAEAITHYEQFFRLLPSVNIGGGGGGGTSATGSPLLIPASIVAKELIISCFRSGNRPKAETHQKNLSAHTKDSAVNAEIQLYEAFYYVRVEPRRAIRTLTQLIDNTSTPLEIAYRALYYRGIAQIQDKKPEEAQADLTLALNTTDERLKNEVRLSLGNLYLSQEDFENALNNYYQVIINDHIGKLAKDAAHNFALTARQIQDWQKAIAAYKIIMDRWGQSHLERETLLTIAFCFIQAKQFDEALNILNQIQDQLATNDLKAEAQYWIAECYVGKADYTQSETAFGNIKLRYPREDKWVRLAQFRIAETYNDRGDTERASVLFHEIIRVYGAGSDVGKEARKYLEEL